MLKDEMILNWLYIVIIKFFSNIVHTWIFKSKWITFFNICKIFIAILYITIFNDFDFRKFVNNITIFIIKFRFTIIWMWFNFIIIYYIVFGIKIIFIVYVIIIIEYYWIFLAFNIMRITCYFWLIMFRKNIITFSFCYVTAFKNYYVIFIYSIIINRIFNIFIIKKTSILLICFIN